MVGEILSFSDHSRTSTMVGVAIIGAGIFATEEHLPALVQAKADVKAVYSRSTKSAQLLKDEAIKTYPNVVLYSDDSGPETTLDKLLSRKDVTAVVVVLPILVQPSIIRKCLAAGKHVLAEKPIAADLATARSLIEDYNKDYKPKGLVFSIAEQFRFMEACELGRKWLVDDKAIGKLTQLHMRIWGNVTPGGKYFETPWRKAPGYQGGFVLDGGVHHIALIRYVSGEEIVETQGFSRQVAEYLPPIDTVNTGILLSGGGTGTVSISFSSALGGNEYSFIGEKGSLVITGSKDGNVLKLDVDGDKKEETVKSHGILNEIRAFLQAAKSGKGQDRAGPEEALNDLAFVESVCQGFGKVKNW